MEFLRQGVRESIQEQGRTTEKPYSFFVSLEETAGNILRDYSKWTFGSDDSYDLCQAVIDGHLVIYEGVHLLAGMVDRVKPPSLDPAEEKRWSEFVSKIEPPLDRDSGGSQDLINIISTITSYLKGMAKGDPEYLRRVRVGIDSVMPLVGRIQGTDHGHLEVRKELLSLKESLEAMGVTTIFTAEASSEGDTGVHLSTKLGNLERFIARGVILLSYRSYGAGELVRNLRVLKMRGRGHKTAPKAYRIEETGIDWIGEVI